MCQPLNFAREGVEVVMIAAERKERLAKSRFRAGFRLDAKDAAYIQKTGWEKIESHAQDFITKRLAPALPENDGKQTPYRGHPVFKAQHASATCCRGCLEKWYGISKGRALTDSQIQQIQKVILDWLKEKTGSVTPCENYEKPAVDTGRFKLRGLDL